MRTNKRPKPLHVDVEQLRLPRGGTRNTDEWHTYPEALSSVLFWAPIPNYHHDGGRVLVARDDHYRPSTYIVLEPYEMGQPGDFQVHSRYDLQRDAFEAAAALAVKTAIQIERDRQVKYVQSARVLDKTGLKTLGTTAN